MDPGQFRLLDLLIVVGYIALSTLAGLAMRGQKTSKDYFLGERSIPGWLLLFSIVATETSSVTFLSVPGMSWKDGGSFLFLQLAFGFLLGRLVVARWLLPWFFGGDYLTAYQVLKTRFDSSVQQTASALFLLMRTLADGLRLFLTALLVGELTGLSPGWSIFVTGLSTLVYTTLGGMKAVLWTDLFQFVVYTLGALIILGTILFSFPGGWVEMAAIAGDAGKFSFIRVIPHAPFWTDPFWLPAGIFGGIFLSMASHGSDQMMVQRYLCAKSQNAASFALVGSGVVVFLQFALFLTIGAGLFALQQSGNWTPEGNILPDRIIGRYVVERLPAGMAGLVVAAVLAAAMSTLSSSLNSSASAFIGDFVKLWFPKITGEQELVTGRWASGVFGLLQMLVAWTAWQAASEKGVIELVFTIAGFLAGLVLGLFLLGIRKKVVRSPSALGGMVLGGAVVLYFWMPTLWGEKGLAWPWYAPLGTLSTLGFGLLLDMPDSKGKIQPRNS